MMPELNLPWNLIALLIPLLGSVVVARIPGSDSRYRFSVVISLLTLLATLGGSIDFSLLHAWEAHDHLDLLERVFHTGILVIDELNAPLLPLAALICFAAVLSTLRTQLSDTPFAMLLFQESMLLGLFGARHPLAVILLSTLVAIPPALVIRRRGHSPRVFLLHMGLSTLLLTAGWLLVPGTVIGHPETSTGPVILIAGALLTAGALLRSGTAPMHCWVTDLFEKTDLATAILTVVPMSGAFVVMRLVLPVAPSWALQSIAVLSLMTSVYASGMALVQTDPRRFLCYLILSHAALVPAGLELLTPIGLTGALCLWISASLSLTGCGLSLRAVQSRAGEISLVRYNGLFERDPFHAIMFLVMGLAAVGFPGTIGFIGAELLVEGAVEVYPLIGTAVVISAAINGISVMAAWFRIFTGTRVSTTIPMPVRPHERIAMLVLLMVIAGGGLYPQPGVASRFHAAIELIRHRDIDADTQHNGQLLVPDPWVRASEQ